MARATLEGASRMKLEKAIEILEHEVTYRDCFDNTDRYHALKLGIEALKSVKQDRALRLPGRLEPLPGETEEYGRGFTETMFINPETE